MTNDIESAIIIYRKGQQRAEPKVLKGGYTMENVISNAFEYYTKQYHAMRRYCEIVDDAEENVKGVGYVRRQMLHDTKNNTIYNAMLINGICVSWRKEAP